MKVFDNKENKETKNKLSSNELKFNLQSSSKNTNEYQSLLTTQTTMNTNRNTYINHVSNMKKRNTFNKPTSNIEAMEFNRTKQISLTNTLKQQQKV